MFFKNIDTWSKKKLRTVDIVANLIYIVLLLVIPIIIICNEYDIFTNTTATYKLTGVGIIVFVLLGLYAYKLLKENVDKMPQVTLNQQRFKFTLKGIFALMPLLIITVGFALVKDDLVLAYNTFNKCMWLMIAANVFDMLFLKYIEAEKDIRADALKINEVEKRRNLV